MIISICMLDQFLCHSQQHSRGPNFSDHKLWTMQHTVKLNSIATHCNILFPKITSVLCVDDFILMHHSNLVFISRHIIAESKKNFKTFFIPHLYSYALLEIELQKIFRIRKPKWWKQWRKYAKSSCQNYCCIYHNDNFFD